MPTSHRKLSQSCRLFPVTALALWSLVAPLRAQTNGFVTIDAPDAGTLGTTAFVINQNGVVAGYYIDDTFAYHGFTRSAQGVITEFDAPRLTNTQGLGINLSGQVVGNGHYQGSVRGQAQGFLRTAKGAFIGFHPSGALYAAPAGINDAGQIAGFYYTRASVSHGFIATISGGVTTYTFFDEPNASRQSGSGTSVTGINSQSAVVGFYVDATAGAYHGFTRDSKGNFTSFDAPGAGTGQSYGTIPLAINASGEIVGYYSDSSALIHAFFRDAQGNVTDFDPPGSNQTFAYSINDSGEVVGYWADSHQMEYGFVREPSGSITSFSVPVQNNGTVVLNINNARQIVGFYYDANAAQHGFLWQAPSGKAHE